MKNCSGKTYILLTHLTGGHKIVSSADELADIFKSIDEYIDLKDETALNFFLNTNRNCVYI